MGIVHLCVVVIVVICYYSFFYTYLADDPGLNGSFLQTF